MTMHNGQVITLIYDIAAILNSTKKLSWLLTLTLATHVGRWLLQSHCVFLSICPSTLGVVDRLIIMYECSFIRISSQLAR